MKAEVGQYRLCRYVEAVYKIVEVKEDAIYIEFIGETGKPDKRPFKRDQIEQDVICTSLIKELI